MADDLVDNGCRTIGKTPLVRLKNVTKDLEATIAVKLEYLNASCSVKDRISLSMIRDAEKQGKITPGKSILIEPTSGNSGIALAYCGRLNGYKVVLIMQASMSIERRTLLKAYGAEVVLVDPTTGFHGMEQRARELVEAIPNAYMLDQFSNPANPDAHFQTTGPEIWCQTHGEVKIVCFGVGSGGTLTGVGRFLKSKNPEIKVYPVEPYESSVINGFPAGHHKIPGIGTGRVPANLDRSLFTEAIRVKSSDAMDMARRLAREEAIFAGPSTGANVCAAIMLAKRPENRGKLIVTTVNSFGERYLSTDVYAGIREEATKMRQTSLAEAIEVVRAYSADHSLPTG